MIKYKSRHTHFVNGNITVRPCLHVGNFNLAIWWQRDKVMFFCQKNCQLEKNVQHSSAIFFSHRCQQCSHNLRLPDCFQKFYTIFFTKNLSGTWVLTYNSSDGKIAKEKLQRLKMHATQETKKLLRIYGKISKWQNSKITLSKNCLRVDKA